MADPTGLSGQLITAAAVTTNTHDHDQLMPLLAASRATAGRDADTALADGGYHSGETLAACRAQGQVVVMPEAQRRALAGPYHQQHFVHDAEHDGFTCPAGQPLTFSTETHRRDRPAARVYRAGGATCRACPAFGTCTKDARQGRSLEVSPWHDDLTRHRQWMETAEAKALGRLRQTLPEPVFGVITEQQGLRRFLLRGLAKVTAEWRLLATAFNLRVLARYWRQGRLHTALGG